MRFIVQHHDALSAQQVLADTLDYQAFRFEGDDRAITSAQDALYQLRRLHRLARFERVIIGYDDACPLQPVAQIQWDDTVEDVGIVWVRRQQNAQPVANGDAGGDDQETISKAG